MVIFIGKFFPQKIQKYLKNKKVTPFDPKISQMIHHRVPDEFRFTNHSKFSYGLAQAQILTNSVRVENHDSSVKQKFQCDDLASKKFGGFLNSLVFFANSCGTEKSFLPKRTNPAVRDKIFSREYGPLPSQIL